MNTPPNFSISQWFRGRTSLAGFALILFLVVGALYAVTAHTAHVFELLPYALLLLCPLLHLFMHGGHGNHAERDHQNEAGSTTHVHEPVNRSRSEE